ncbi:MAG: histidine kinase [Lachnospiraceae bacterium]|nr:histidine kinase [Lachnospiraceae bacterium]
MNFSEIQSFFRRRNVVMVEYLVMAIATIMSIVLLYDRLESKRLLAEYSLPVTIAGEYSVDGGQTFMPFDRYDDIDMSHLDRLILRGNLAQDIKIGHKLYMFLNYIDAAVYVNGTIVYANDPEVAYCWDAIEGIAIGPHDEVQIELNTRRAVVYNVAFKQFLMRMTSSTKNAILSDALRIDRFRLFGDLLLMFIGILVLQTYVEFRRSGNTNPRGIVECGFGIITGALTCFINADYVTLILPQFEVLEYVDTLTQVYTVLFVMAYLRRYVRNPKSREKVGWLVLLGYNVIFIYMLWRTFSAGSSYAAMIPIMVIGGFSALYFIYILIRDFVAQTGRLEKSIAVTSFLLLVCVVMEIIYFLITGTYKVDFMEVGLIVFAVTQYVVLTEEGVAARHEAARAHELETEITNSRINIMVSQIQPHFMYNALSTIRALITKNPDEARTAIDFFTKYVRANMDSLSQKEAIPFKKEMDHVESYLYIEKLRFGDMLKVVYDIQTYDFTIPSMTVQTLAENAVKHGLLAREEGGTLTIRSRETANCFEVQIEDDGVGFDTTVGLDDSRSHIGIENSRKRLAALCGGTISIGSKKGVGTVVTITIPK